MNDYLGILLLIVALIISFLISKKDYSNWDDLDSKDKFYILRPPIIIIIGIILLTVKVLKK